MSVIDWIKNLLGGADAHAQTMSDTVQNIGDSEIAQNVQDKVSEVGGQAEELKNNLGEQTKGMLESLKDKLPK